MASLDPAAALALLAANPHHIASVTEGLSEKQLTWKPSSESWSIHEVVVHLRACSDVWGESIEKILQQQNPTIKYVSPRTWVRKTNYLDQDFQSSFSAFRAQRQDLLRILKPLGEKDWMRTANVKAANVRTETVLSYAERLAAHEAGHCGQIDRILQAMPLSR